MLFIIGTGITAGTKITAMYNSNAVLGTANWGGNQLHVLSLSYGTIQVGQSVFGSGMASGTVISSYGNGTGLTGTYVLSLTQPSNATALSFNASYTGKGGVGTYEMSQSQAAPGTTVLVTSSSGAAVTGTWSTTSKTLSVTSVSYDVITILILTILIHIHLLISTFFFFCVYIFYYCFKKQYTAMKEKYTNSWDANLNYGCVCDSSWPVGLGYGETQQSEYFGAACELQHCPTGILCYIIMIIIIFNFCPWVLIVLFTYLFIEIKRG